jgi:hypothetical protein
VNCPSSKEAGVKVKKLAVVIMSMLLVGSFIALRTGAFHRSVPEPESPAVLPGSERVPVFLPGSKSEEEARQTGDGIAGGFPPSP